MTAPLWPVVNADELLIGVVSLFAGRPDLPQKIIDSLARDEIGGKTASVFDYLFVAASSKADGAKDYFAGYRVRRPEEIDLTLGAFSAREVIEGAHGASPRGDDG
jgi:hypothetical protein